MYHRKYFLATSAMLADVTSPLFFDYKDKLGDEIEQSKHT